MAMADQWKTEINKARQNELDGFVDPVSDLDWPITPGTFRNALLPLAMQPANHPNEVCFYDNACLVIRDRYPKARYHFLVLPRRPLDNINCVTSRDLPLLRHMEARGDWLAASVKGDDQSIIFRCGYHAIPSMRQLHLHVISQDFDSPWMKTKKHWNSFTSAFFVDTATLIASIEATGKFDAAPLEAHLHDPLLCHRCAQPQRGMQTLKAHLASHA